MGLGLAANVATAPLACVGTISPCLVVAVGLGRAILCRTDSRSFTSWDDVALLDGAVGHAGAPACPLKAAGTNAALRVSDFAAIFILPGLMGIFNSFAFNKLAFGIKDFPRLPAELPG